MVFLVHPVHEYVLPSKDFFVYNIFVQGLSGDVGRSGSPGTSGPKGKFIIFIV
jgi:hypothetical protein